jgi:hypothetical protein
LRFLPTSPNGFVLSAGSLLIFVAVLVLLMTGGNLKFPSLLQSIAPTSIPTSAPPTLTLTLPIVSTATSSPEALTAASPTPVIETSTAVRVSDTPTITPVPLTLQVTLPPAGTPTITLTIESTPVYARVNASQGNGANLRQNPGGKFIIELDNGSIVEVLSDTQDVNGVVWAHVIANRSNQRYEGWVLQAALDVAASVPVLNPSSTSATPTITSTP